MSIQHVALELRRSDVEACVAFYAMLGFTRVDPPESLADRAAWLQSGATQVHLLWVDDPVVPREGHVAVVVPDYASVTQALRAAGFEVDTRAEHWGAPRSFVRDPAGHRVELMAAPPSTEAG